MEATLSQRGSTGQPSGQAAGRVSSLPPPASWAAGTLRSYREVALRRLDVLQP
jgi:hypothetical protein